MEKLKFHRSFRSYWICYLEVDGVYGMRANLTSDLKTIFGRSEHTKGVRFS